MGFFEGLGHFSVELFTSEAFRIDKKSFVTLFFGALKRVAVGFVANYYGELDAGHEACLHLIDDGLKVGTVGGGEDADAKHRLAAYKYTEDTRESNRNHRGKGKCSPGKPLDTGFTALQACEHIAVLIEKIGMLAQKKSVLIENFRMFFEGNSMIF